jgi:hypothetical protein
VLENRGAFQGTPSEKCWQGHKGLHYEKTTGPSPQGRWLIPIQGPEFGAGNDCDALRSAMEQGRDGPREPVVDAEPEDESSRLAGNGVDFPVVLGGD